jgi:hypothetical protein
VGEVDLSPSLSCPSRKPRGSGIQAGEQEVGIKERSGAISNLCSDTAAVPQGNGTTIIQIDFREIACSVGASVDG